MKGFCFCMSMGIALLLCIGTCSCAHTPGKGNNSAPGNTLEQEIILGETLLGALRDDNYKKLALTLKKHSAQVPGFQQFQQTRKAFTQQFGLIRSFRFLAELKTPLVRNLLWIVELQRTGENKQVISQDLLFRLVTVRADQSVRIMGMGFF